MSIEIYHDLIQGSDEWLAARRGLLTASEMRLVITPTLKVAVNDKATAHLYELAAQRVTSRVEPSYVSDDMLRGIDEEQYARDAYSAAYAEVEEIGFVTNDKWGFTIGSSPDGFVGADGMIEVKAPRQKSQFEAIVNQEMPDAHAIQVQTGLLVSERNWCDYISYHGGMHMVTVRIYADTAIQDAIVEASRTFYAKLDGLIQLYHERLADKTLRLIPTERRIEQEISI